VGTLKNQLAQYDKNHALLRQCTRRQVIYAKAAPLVAK
jgi:hypothetical protein